ncbi:transcriptional repressor [bacterium]|nr:transcriptional repressor [bacterium]
MYGRRQERAHFFRHHGFRCTLPREVILDILYKTKSHLSAEDIYFKIHPLHPQIGLTTVYRTLDLLSRMGAITKFDFGDGKARYELIKTGNDSHHYHLVCRKCNRVVDYSDFVKEETRLIKEIGKELSKKYNFKIDSHQIHFQGLCNKCR